MWVLSMNFCEFAAVRDIWACIFVCEFVFSYIPGIGIAASQVSQALCLVNTVLHFVQNYYTVSHSQEQLKRNAVILSFRMITELFCVFP